MFVIKHGEQYYKHLAINEDLSLKSVEYVSLEKAKKFPDLFTALMVINLLAKYNQLPLEYEEIE